MTIRGRYLTLRGVIPWVAVTLALIVAPAHAFFPPVPVHIPPPKPPIHVPPPPARPPVVTPPSVTPPGGGGTGGSSGGTTQPPDTNPEPASLVLALLGSAGVGLFAACRRRGRQKGPASAEAQTHQDGIGV